MAAKGKGRGELRDRRGRAPRIGRRRLRVLWAVAIVGAAAYLYYRPLSSYVETRRDLGARKAEVETLRQERSSLQLRLANSTSVTATEREARRLGYIRPGERLFVIKGIDAWRRSQSAKHRKSG